MGALVGNAQSGGHVPQPVMGQLGQQLPGQAQLVQGVVSQRPAQVFLEGIVKKGGVKANVVAQKQVPAQKILHLL